MNGHKSSSIFCCFLVVFVLMAAGCALSPTLKRYGTLPPTVKEAMVVELSGNETEWRKEVVNSGIYLNEGELYSIVAAGYVNAWWGETWTLNRDFSLDLRIGQKPYFTTLSGTYYSLNGTTRIAHANGNLYLAVNYDKHNHPLAVNHKVRKHIGDVDVLIIVWKTGDRAQIVGSLQKLREDAKKFGTDINFINGFDDAIDRAKELRQDMSG